MKVAIVHDWLVGGGAERVVLELHHMFPEAPIYTSFCSDEWRQKLDGKVVTGYLQKWPFSKLRKYLPILRIWWFTHLDFSGYNLVISSSGNGEAKGIKVPNGTKHVCYCHSPTHFYWRHYDKYIKHPGFGVFSPLARIGLKLLVGPLRKWDLKASQRPDVFIANSSHIQADIKTYYNREATVIHPPVDIERFTSLDEPERSGFVTAGRLVPYKHTDLIVETCTLLNLPLKVIGKGPELSKLKSIAGPSIEFLGFVPDSDLVNQLASAEAFLFAAFEDFGVTPVEAMAAGTPVIAYKAGGALDYVAEGTTGIFFSSQTVDSLSDTLKKFDLKKFDPNIISQATQKFSSQVFRQKIIELINKTQGT